METLAIGERKVFTDVTLEVVQSTDWSCNDCWFYGQPQMCFEHPRRSIMGDCTFLSRADGIDVIFRAIKKAT